MPSPNSGPSASAGDVQADGELAAGYAALKAEPDNARAAEDLAQALVERGRQADAVAVLEAALARRSDSRPLRRMLAQVLPGLNRHEEAESHWRELLLLDPSDDATMVQLAGLLIVREALPDAIDVLQRAMRANPENAAALFELGAAWAELGETGRAEEAFGRYLSLDPADAFGAGAALKRLDAESLPPAYVRTLFDQYAARFDSDLLGTLDYRAPELLREAVNAAGLIAGNILDLGCGTGLAGVAFRDLAGALDGVDLSPRMVDTARARRIYDRLFVADAVAFLRAVEAGYDLVIAADMIVYLGDLAPLFAAVAQALRPSGAFAFTVEELGGEGYRLGPKRRFAHSETYVRQTAAAAGFDVIYVRAAPLRTEAGANVQGLVCMVKRPGRAAG